MGVFNWFNNKKEQKRVDELEEIRANLQRAREIGAYMDAWHYLIKLRKNLEGIVRFEKEHPSDVGYVIKTTAQEDLDFYYSKGAVELAPVHEAVWNYAAELAGKSGSYEELLHILLRNGKLNSLIKYVKEKGDRMDSLAHPDR